MHLFNHCRFPYCIPRNERGVGTVFYEMPYALLELGFIECCNHLVGRFFNDCYNIAHFYVYLSLKLVTLGHFTLFVRLRQLYCSMYF